MILSFHPCFEADEQIILGDRSPEETDVSLMRRAEAILLPQNCSRELFDAAASSCIRVFPNYGVRFEYRGKIGQKRLFENLGLPHPETRVWPSVRDLEAFERKTGSLPHPFPFCIKSDQGHEGEAVHVIRDRDAMDRILAEMRLHEVSGCRGFLSQAFVQGGGNVLRVVILGQRFVTYWKRPSHAEAGITTVSRGAVIDHGWRPDLQEKAIALSHELKEGTGINLAAVDFIFPLAHEAPTPLLLEINYSFGRRGLGGTLAYYELLHAAIREWLASCRLDADAVRLV